MLGHREFTMEDYTTIFRRRIWVILLCAIIVFASSVLASRIIPPRYVSQTLVLVDQQQVPQDYVKPVVSGDLEQRLASMKEQILSRSRIQPIIERFNLFADPRYTMDERVARTQKAIGIRTISSARGQMPGFYITFTARSAHIAQQVCGEITSLFVADSLRQSELSAEGTSDFLKQQLDSAKQVLDEQDAKLAAFQQQYFGMLPDQENSNSNTLQALTTQLNSATETLSRLQQNETFLQAMIAEQTHDLQGDQPAAVVTADEREKELKDLIEQKRTLESQYTADYPDVIAISRKIADLRAQLAHPPAPAATAAVAAKPADSAQLEQLRAQLRAAEQSTASEREQQAQIEKQIRTYEARIESSPHVEEEYKQITRDHDTALQFYNSLLAKMNESEMATALEQRQQGERFRVMDAPNLPDAPVFPNRMVFSVGGLAGGFGLGVLIAGLLEYRDNSLRSDKDVWAFTKLPTLATISHIDELRGFDRNGRLGRILSRSSNPVESAGS